MFGDMFFVFYVMFGMGVAKAVVDGFENKNRGFVGDFFAKVVLLCIWPYIIGGIIFKAMDKYQSK